MLIKNFKKLPALVLVLCTSSCGGKPYVFIENEFKRETKTFLHGITEREEVIVCYNLTKTTPKIVNRLANTECNKFGKPPDFHYNTFNKCPLFMPIAAFFDCL